MSLLWHIRNNCYTISSTGIYLGATRLFTLILIGIYYKSTTIGIISSWPRAVQTNAIVVKTESIHFLLTPWLPTVAGLSSIKILPTLYWNSEIFIIHNNSEKIVQSHRYWCPDSLLRQDTSRHDTVNAKIVGLWSNWLQLPVPFW